MVLALSILIGIITGIGVVGIVFVIKWVFSLWAKRRVLKLSDVVLQLYSRLGYQSFECVFEKILKT